MRYRVAFCGTATVRDLPHGLDEAEVLGEHFSEVMDHLVDLEEDNPVLHDADLSAQLATGEVQISIVVDNDVFEDAAKLGISTIRCAVHSAGGYTPGWEDTDGQTWELEDVSSRQEPLAPV